MTTTQEIKLQKSQLEHALMQESQAVKVELSKIDSLENKVKEMQLQLQALNKVEKSCDKKNKEGLQSTILTIRNKVLMSESQSLAKLRQQKAQNNIDSQKSKVKQIRQVQASQLQSAKRQNQRVKQNMMREIKQISLRNDEIIRRTKDMILQKNKLKAQNIKSEKENFRQSMMESKMRQMKQKHELQMQRSRLRIQKKTELQKKYEQLMKQKQAIESRVQEKKEFNKKLEQLKNNIGRMENAQITQTIKDIKHKIKNYEDLKLNQEGMTMEELERDPEYIKYNLFQKYFQDQQLRREERGNFVF